MGIVQSIDQAYCGRAKIERLLYIANQCRGLDVGMRSLKRVHDELKEHVSVHYCRHFESCLSLMVRILINLYGWLFADKGYSVVQRSSFYACGAGCTRCRCRRVRVGNMKKKYKVI